MATPSCRLATAAASSGTGSPDLAAGCQEAVPWSSPRLCTQPNCQHNRPQTPTHTQGDHIQRRAQLASCTPANATNAPRPSPPSAMGFNHTHAPPAEPPQPLAPAHLAVSVTHTSQAPAACATASISMLPSGATHSRRAPQPSVSPCGCHGAAMHDSTAQHLSRTCPARPAHYAPRNAGPTSHHHSTPSTGPPQARPPCVLPGPTCSVAAKPRPPPPHTHPHTALPPHKRPTTQTDLDHDWEVGRHVAAHEIIVRQLGRGHNREAPVAAPWRAPGQPVAGVATPAAAGALVAEGRFATQCGVVLHGTAQRGIAAVAHSITNMRAQKMQRGLHTASGAQWLAGWLPSTGVAVHAL